MTIHTLLAAVAAAALLGSAAQAQTPPADELKAAHALVDEGIAQSMRDGMVEAHASLPFDAVEPDESRAMEEAFNSALPRMIAKAQNLTATAFADRWTLEQLNAADSISDADGEAVFATLADPMHDLGVQFAAEVMKAGCQARATPSERCRAILDAIADYEAGRLKVP